MLLIEIGSVDLQSKDMDKGEMETNTARMYAYIFSTRISLSYET